MAHTMVCPAITHTYIMYNEINVNKSVCYLQVVSLQNHYVRPATDDISENVLTDECKLQTGLSEEAVKNGKPLEQVLDEVSFVDFICSFVC